MTTEFGNAGIAPAKMPQVPQALDGQRAAIDELVEILNFLEKRIVTVMQPEMTGQSYPDDEKEAPKCELAGVISENTSRIRDCVSKLSGFMRRLEL